MALNTNNNKLKTFRLFAGTSVSHIICMVIAFSMALPFVWMMLASVSSLLDLEDSSNWIPEPFRWKNYTEVFDDSPDRSLDAQVVEVKDQKPHDILVLDCREKPDEPYKRMEIEEDNQVTLLTKDGEILKGSNLSPGQEIRVDLKPGKGINFGRYYWNSIFIAAWVTFLQVFTSSLAAFSFSRIDWPGRDKVFLMYLGTMMLPGLIMMIPNYQIMIKLGWVDSYIGLILPAAFSAFGTFLLRQFMLGIPSSLDEAAEIDGASKWQVYWNVILPLCRPGLITLTIFTFMGTYRGFFWPLVMLKSEDKLTLPIGLMYFNSTNGSETGLMMAAAAMMIIPLVLLFILMQKWLVKGIQLGAVKG